MAEHTLLTSQWDDVFGAVEAAEFEPSEFRRSSAYGEIYGGSVPTLVHSPTGFDFAFDFNPGIGLFAPNWSPGEAKPRDATSNLVEWANVLILIRRWLINVAREESSPDLWTMLDQERHLLTDTGPTEETPNTPFTSGEQAEVAKQLNEIQRYLVQTHQVDQKALASRIEYLIEASGRMGRKDWLNIFVGAIFSWALTGLVPPEGVREVLSLATRTLGHLFGGGLLGLPVP